jgi:hypothetical protein
MTPWLTPSVTSANVFAVSVMLKFGPNVIPGADTIGALVSAPTKSSVTPSAGFEDSWASPALMMGYRRFAAPGPGSIRRVEPITGPAHPCQDRVTDGISRSRNGTGIMVFAECDGMSLTWCTAECSQARVGARRRIKGPTRDIGLARICQFAGRVEISLVIAKVSGLPRPRFPRLVAA